jgi:hypothetical protein
LYLAAQNGHADVAKLLLDASADRDKASNAGVTPLYIAAEKGHADIAKLLLDAGADRDQAQKSVGWTPLIMAASKGHVEIAKLLLDGGADRDKASNTGLGHVEIVKLLREAGADPGKSKRLMAAKLALEKEDEAAQRRSGKTPWTRIAGQPGSVKHDLGNGMKSFSSEFVTIGAPEALANSGVLYYEIVIMKMDQKTCFLQFGVSLKDGVEVLHGPSDNGVGDSPKSWGVDGDRKCAWNDGKHPWP